MELKTKNRIPIKSCNIFEGIYGFSSLASLLLKQNLFPGVHFLTQYLSAKCSRPGTSTVSGIAKWQSFLREPFGKKVHSFFWSFVLVVINLDATSALLPENEANINKRGCERWRGTCLWLSLCTWIQRYLRRLSWTLQARRPMCFLFAIN